MNAKHALLWIVAIMMWQPNSVPQAEALSRSEREVLYGGARGGGKTEAGIAWIGEPEYINHVQYSSLVVRKNSKDLQAWVFRAKQFFDDEIEVGHGGSILNWRKGGHTFIGHLKDERSLESMLGIEYQKVLIEELTQVKSEEMYLRMLGSCRSTIGLPSQVFSTTNPGGIGHVWVKNRFVKCARNKVYKDERGLTRIFIPSRVYDNVDLCKKDPTYVVYLESLPPKLRKAWLEGDWDVLSGQFFETFGAHLKCTPFAIPPHEANIYGSLDYGETNPTSFGLWHVASDGVAYRILTYYERGKSCSEHARGIIDKIKSCVYTSGVMPKVVFADPSMFIKRRLDDTYSKSPADIFNEYGLTLTPANNDRVPGWRVMNDAYTANHDGTYKHFYFSVDNDEYEEYIPTLMHDDKNPDDIEKGGEDHVGDESRYFFVAAMGLRTCAIKEATKKKTDYKTQLALMGRRGQVGVTGL